MKDRIAYFFQSLGQRPALITPDASYSYLDLYRALYAYAPITEPSPELSWPALITLLSAALQNQPFSFTNTAPYSGLWLQTTGTTGEPKWVHHAWDHWLAQYRWKDGGERALLQVMAFDHIGGLHSIFSALSRGMTIVLPAAKDGETVKVALQTHRVFLLPSTPAHLALLLQSGCFNELLPHLRLISYGAEAMSTALKQSISTLQPHIRWRETYGSTETGILPLQSGAEPGSWQVNFPYQIVDGELYVKNLAGNWQATGDFVEEIAHNRLRFKGRKAARIKVGGILVDPEQTASHLRRQAGVWQVAVEIKPNPMLGQVLEARIWADSDADLVQLEKHLRTSFPADFTKEARPVRYCFENYFHLNSRLKSP